MIRYMIVGGQWGSEGKGLFAGYMARRKEPDTVVCQFGPNAGHTWIEGDTPIVFKSLPVGSIAPSVRTVLIGPGAVVDAGQLALELDFLKQHLKDKKVYVHECTAVLMPQDAEAERRGLGHIASTMQGTCEAMIRKIRRSTDAPPARLALRDVVQIVPHSQYRELINRSECLQIEGSQGMDLSINCGHAYPYVTSRDCTPAQVLADCAVHPRELTHIYACIRTYPIRVGNLRGSDGLEAGWSGPCYDDQEELNWERIGQPEEYTTVTRRVRRVFSFSKEQMRKLVREVKPDGVFLNFANYVDEDALRKMIYYINMAAGMSVVRWTGHGPRHTDVREHGHVRRKPPPPEYGE